jgi:hypothetical protein
VAASLHRGALHRQVHHHASRALTEVTMGGINVHCGSFSSVDKSCSAFEGVIAGLEDMASDEERPTVIEIKAALDDVVDHLLIEPAQARKLLPLLRKYAARVDSQLAIPGDPFDQMDRDDRASPERQTELKYGAGLGWRAWCASNLLRAFEVADVESEQVALVWG